MYLRGQYRIKAILRKTQAEMFRDLRVGDVVNFSFKIHHLGHNRGSSYAAYLAVESGGVEVEKSPNQLASILSCFEFEEV